MTEQEERALTYGGVRTGKVDVAICRILQMAGYPVRIEMCPVEVGENKYVAMPRMVYGGEEEGEE